LAVRSVALVVADCIGAVWCRAFAAALARRRGRNSKRNFSKHPRRLPKKETLLLWTGAHAQDRL
jgi:hypothetical protein